MVNNKFPIQFVTILIVSILSIFEVISGIYSYSLSADQGYSWSSLNNCVLLVLVGIIFIECVSRAYRVNKYFAVGVLTVLATIATAKIFALISAFAVILASYILGNFFISLFNANKESKNDWGISTLLGIVFYGTTIGLLAHFPINYPGLYFFIVLTPLILGFHQVNDFCVYIYKFRKNKNLGLLDLWICILFLIYFFQALMPEIGHDALSSHFFIPEQIKQKHYWGFDVGIYVFAVMPMLGAWIYSLANMLGGEISVRLINLTFILICAHFLRKLTLLLRGSERGSRWGVLIFLATPLTFLEGSSLFIEAIWAALLLGAIYLMVNISNNSNPKSDNFNIIITGILLGGALATKLITVAIVLPFIFYWFLYCGKSYLKFNTLIYYFIAIFGVIIIGGIPYLTAWLVAGNPVFPFFNKLFLSQYWYPINFEAPSVFTKGLGFYSLHEMTFQSQKYLEGRVGSMGFELILLLPASILLGIFLKKWKSIALIVFSIIFTALVFNQTAYLRYIFPVLPVFIAAIFSILSNDEILNKYTSFLIFIMIALSFILNIIFFKSATHYGALEYRAIFSESGRYQYLNENLPIRNIVQFVNYINVDNRPVAVFSSPLTAGLSSDALYAGWQNFSFERSINGAKDVDQIARVIMQNNVTYIIVDKNWGDDFKRGLVMDSIEPIAGIGNLTVGKLKDRFRSLGHSEELLSNPDFSSNVGWGFDSNSRVNGGKSIKASVAQPFIEVIPVEANKKYFASINSKCLQGNAKGRVQVNWMDKNNKFIDASISLYDCTQGYEIHNSEMLSPQNASTAIFYLNSHTIAPVEIIGASFKGSRY